MMLHPISFQWSNLLICSWAVEPNAIKPLLTPGLIPHCWHDSAYVSLVGLTVSDHRCAGVALRPRNFRQVNIRSYVKPVRGGPPGVLFIRQFIAHRLTAMAARVLWREPFRKLAISADNSCTWDEVEYQWPNGHMKATASELWRSSEPDSLEEFLTVRQWAYQPRRIPRRYAAEREPWLLNAPYAYDVECDFAALTQGLMPNPDRPPDSALLADGGPVRITIPEWIKPLRSPNNQRQTRAFDGPGP
jgi:uncharacterized protein YqjF (DUF2071 family)